MKNIPDPPYGIPYFTHLLSLGISPYGESRCKRCGATSEYIKCPYCHRKKEHALDRGRA